MRRKCTENYVSWSFHSGGFLLFLPPGWRIERDEIGKSCLSPSGRWRTRDIVILPSRGTDPHRSFSSWGEDRTVSLSLPGGHLIDLFLLRGEDRKTGNLCVLVPPRNKTEKKWENCPFFLPPAHPVRGGKTGKSFTRRVKPENVPKPYAYNTLRAFSTLGFTSVCVGWLGLGCVCGEFQAFFCSNLLRRGVVGLRMNTDLLTNVQLSCA